MTGVSVKVLGSVSPYCKGSMNCPGFLIEYRGNKYLFDCGNGITRLLNFPDDLYNMNIFISHLHADHVGDLSSIAYALFVYKKLGYISDVTDVYIPSKDKRIECFYENFHKYTKEESTIEYEYFKKLEDVFPVRINGYQDLNYQNNSVRITSLKVPHPISSYAFKMETPLGSIVYSGDTGYTDDLIEFASGVDLFICESTFIRGNSRSDNGHLFAHEAGIIASKAQVGKLLLTHFFPEVDKELYLNEAKEYFSNVEVAQEGKILKLGR
jgi:ribonuclease BN (tRNA processing enzyme)